MRRAGREDLSTAGSPLDRLEGGWNPEFESEVGDTVEAIGPYPEMLYQALNRYDSLLGSPES